VFKLIFKLDGHIVPPYYNTYSGSSPLLIVCICLKATNCIKWLLENGADPNIIFHKRSALAHAFRHGSAELLINSGATLEVTTLDWRELSIHPEVDLNSRAAVRNMLYRGACIPPNIQVAPEFSIAYNIILQREEACKRACYTFILSRLLSQDLTEWLLKHFILPSKRNHVWSPDMMMPEGFD
jgi:hypothetical protein